MINYGPGLQALHTCELNTCCFGAQCEVAPAESVWLWLQVSYVNLRKDPEGANLFLKMRMTDLRKYAIVNHSRQAPPATYRAAL